MKITNKALILLLIGLFSSILQAEKIKDIVNVVGVRENQLLGYGLVIGLNGSGDKTSSTFTMQSISNMLESVNVKVPTSAIASKNVAAVMVTAKLPPFARQGDKLDVVVSSIGDAKSIAGGSLILTPLTGVDGRIYATAQGTLSVSTAEGGSLLSGSVSSGALVERELSCDLASMTNATLSLKTANFQNAIKAQKAINEFFEQKLATATDSRTIRLQKPESMNMVEFLAQVEEIDMSYTMGNSIIINERTGAVVAGVDLRVSPVVVNYNNINLRISNKALENNDPETVVNLGDGVNLDRANGSLHSNTGFTTVANVVKALQRLGASPRDVISVLETIKQSGAITANIEVL